MGGGLARFRRPENEPVGCPFRMVLVGLGHVSGHRTVAPLERRPLVTRHPCALVEDLNDVRTETHLELLLDQGVGYRIVVAVDE